MNITGIIVEYNPFHNGHIYHIEKARELTKPDLLIAVCSGNFSQRGEVSVIDKFLKTEAALKHGVDLVAELPFIYTNQSASVFGRRSVEILDLLKADNLVFGSETNNLEELKNFADHSINVDHLKEEMDKGTSYPKAYGLLAGSLYPNDILAVAYLKALKDMKIEPFSIQRTNSYNDLELHEIASAKAIREALKEGKDVSGQTPVMIEDPHFIEELYPYLQRLLLTMSRDDLKEIFLVSEGIESLLIRNAQEYDDYEGFINASLSKRYTRARIARISLNIMNQIKKQDVRNDEKLSFVRILGFNRKGREYLRTLKDEDFRIVTQFKNLPSRHKEIEWKAANLYASLLKDRKAYLRKELKGPIIID